MTIEQALKIKQNWTAEQARNDLERLLLRDERPANKVIALACKALEKQIPEKGIMIGDEYSSVLSCPNFRKPIVNVWNIDNYEPNYCHYCGQKLDWSDEKNENT